MFYDNDFFLGTFDNCHVGCCPIARTEADARRAHLSTHPGFSVPFVYFSFDSGESYGLYLKVNFNTNLLSQRQHSDLAGKITGMLLEIDNSELLHMLEDPASLQAKVAICSVEAPLHLVVFRQLCMNLFNTVLTLCNPYHLGG